MDSFIADVCFEKEHRCVFLFFVLRVGRFVGVQLYFIDKLSSRFWVSRRCICCGPICL